MAPNTNNTYMSTHQLCLAPNFISYMPTHVLATIAVVEGGHAMRATKRAQRDLSTSLSDSCQRPRRVLKLKVGSVREIGDPRGEKRSRRERGDPEDREAEAAVGGPHSIASYVV